MENSERFATPAIDIQFIHNSERGQALEAAKQLLEFITLFDVQEWIVGGKAMW